MAEDEKFLSRWARRKAESRSSVPDDDAQDREREAIAGEPADAHEVTENPDDHPAAGIDIDTLDANSDFTVFMHEKVPQAIRRRALRKLWLSDPVYANLDGLNDYDGDFTDSATVVAGLKATYDEAVRRMKAEEAREAREAEAREAQRAADAEHDEQDPESGEIPESGESPSAAEPAEDDEKSLRDRRTASEDGDLDVGSDEA